MIQYPVSNSFADDVLLSCMTLDAKPWAYELNSDLKNKSDRTLCNLWIHIWTNRLQVYLQVKDNKIISVTNLFQQYIENLSEW